MSDGTDIPEIDEVRIQVDPLAHEAIGHQRARLELLEQRTGLLELRTRPPVVTGTPARSGHPVLRALTWLVIAWCIGALIGSILAGELEEEGGRR